LVDNPDFNFKGQPLATTRIIQKYKEIANWIDANLGNELEPTKNSNSSHNTDALGRITRKRHRMAASLPFLHEGGLLNGESVGIPLTQSHLFISKI
jgi:hypothetical protein